MTATIEERGDTNYDNLRRVLQENGQHRFWVQCEEPEGTVSLPNEIEFADWNAGRSFEQGYGLLEKMEAYRTRSTGIFIETLKGESEADTHERARRVVACWNACAGISTEAIETGYIAKQEASNAAATRLIQFYRNEFELHTQCLDYIGVGRRQDAEAEYTADTLMGEKQ